MGNNAFNIFGARQNNLRNLDLEIPLNQITVVSGSCKSSLAFDTLYAEGQRRYVKTFSTYATQFMDRMDWPLVDRIEGIPPAYCPGPQTPGAHLSLDCGDHDGIRGLCEGAPCRARPTLLQRLRDEKGGLRVKTVSNVTISNS